MMLSGLVFRLTMVGMVLGVMFWIGWSVPAPQFAQPLQPAALHDSGGQALESVSPPSSQRTPSAPLERRREHDVSRRSTVALDLNHASAQDFERLPGLGPVLAGRIIEYRASQGKFRDVEQLRRVKGIGPKTFEQIRPHMVVAPAEVPKAPRKAA